MRTEQSEPSYIIDGTDGVYRRNRVHLGSTTLETSLEKSSSPASAQTVPTRAQRIGKEPDWFKDYEFNF